MSFVKGGLGGILGGLAAAGLSALVPGLGIPLLALEAGGSALGQTAQGLVSGEPIGKAALGGLEAGALAAGTGAALDLATGTPLGSTSSPLTSLFGGGAGGAGGAASAAGDIAAGNIAANTGGAQGAAAGLTAAPTSALPESGFGAGGAAGSGLPNSSIADIANIAQQTGAPAASGGPLSYDAASNFLNSSGGQSFAGTSGPPSNLLVSGTDAPISGGVDGGALGASGGGGGAGSLSSPYSPDVPGTVTRFDAAGDVLNSSQAHTPSFLEKLGLGNLSPLQLGGLGLAAASMVPSIFKGDAIPGEQPLQQNAGLLTHQGNQAISALATGAVPPGAQTLLDQTATSEKSKVRSHFSNLGLSGSTMESSALQQVDQNTEANKWNIIREMTSTGLAEINAANTIYSKLMDTELRNDAETQAALARFGGALAGAGSRSAA